MRNGNGHNADKKRPLSPEEKAFLLKSFTDADGRVTDDLCVAWRRLINLKKPSEPVTSFQVAGYMVHLHARVKAGAIGIRNMEAYSANMAEHRSRYPKRYPAIAADRPRLIAAVKPLGFWEFYTSHKTDFDDALDVICEQLSQHMEKGDLRTEILLRLERNKIHLKWKPTKAGLRTYLSNKIKGYANHVLDLAQYRPVWTGKGIAEKWRMSQVVMDSEDGESCFQIAGTDDFEAEIEAQDTLRVLRDRMPRDLRTMLDRQVDGLTYAEIAVGTGKEVNAVVAKARVVRDHATVTLMEIERNKHVQATRV